MAYFYFHPTNAPAKKLAEYTETTGFMFQHRGELELRLQRLLLDSGVCEFLAINFHTILGTLNYPIGHYVRLNPEDPMDKQVIKITTAQKKTAWSWLKVMNGNMMNSVIGYTSLSSQSPIMLTPAQQAQKGVISAYHVPTAHQ